MVNWKDIHQDFTPELQKEWENKGFSYEQTQEWVKALKDFFEVTDYDFCAWLRDKKSLTPATLVYDELNYFAEKYNNYVRAKNNKEWLESQAEYNTKEKRKQIIEPDISFKGLKGELDLSDFVNLRKLNCWGNELTRLILPVNPTNLEELYLGYNKFTGSLDFLSNMKNLKVLEITDNDFDEVNLDKLPRSLEEVNYNILRKDCKLTKIIPELNKVKYGFCQKCHQPNTSRKWCQPCAEKEWQKEIKNLTGQELVKKFIQQQGKDAWGNYRLQWIPYEWFGVEKDECGNNKVLGEGSFGKVYKANWKEREQHLRHNPYNCIVLKVLHNSQNIALEFLIEMANNILVNDYNTSPYTVKCWGISQDPITKNYIMVMDHIKGGNLREYLKQNSQKLNLEIKLKKLYDIAMGLNFVHEQNLVHKDLHAGNILNDKYGDGDGDGYDRSFVTDFGLSQPADYQKEEGKIYGVLPYIAPEVLQGQPYTQESDIYSFGIIAYELLANSYPCPEMDNMELALKICRGYRPNLEELKIPQLLKDLIKRCWDADPKKRPTVCELYEILGAWKNEIFNKKNTQFYQQHQTTEKEYKHFSKNISYKIHPTAVLTSKPINTKVIARLFQKSEEQALELETKKIEKEINQPLTNELKELVSKFIQAGKQMKKDKKDKEARKEIKKLDKKLREKWGKDVAKEKIQIIINYCERFIKAEQELEGELQVNIETPTNK